MSGEWTINWLKKKCFLSMHEFVKEIETGNIRRRLSKNILTKYTICMESLNKKVTKCQLIWLLLSKFKIIISVSKVSRSKQKVTWHCRTRASSFYCLFIIFVQYLIISWKQIKIVKMSQTPSKRPSSQASSETPTPSRRTRTSQQLVVPETPQRSSGTPSKGLAF